jgi:HAD superfamily hydrolase (TIGR01484 family)
MYFLALAADYDGTIAWDGIVSDDTYAALEDLKKTGRRLILVTGRNLASLMRAFPRLKLFDRVVAENGALLYDPATEQQKVIAPAPSPVFVEALQKRGVSPLTVGRSIVATWHPNEATVLEVIKELGLELHIIFNKGAVMVLPPGVNKASGLCAALAELELSPINVVGVGDAENDHAFLKACGCSAAVSNAVVAIKEEADIPLSRDHGSGVIELIQMIRDADSHMVPPERHGLLVGEDAQGRHAYLEPHVGGVLIAGSSGIGKSTLASALTERMAERKLQFCVFDPEGDYTELLESVSNGDASTPPVIDEVLNLLRKLGANVVVNTQALNLAERPQLFAKLLPQILSLRARSGRPHWLLIDEAHHLVAAPRHDVGEILPEVIPAAIYITVHPDAMAPNALRTVEYVLALGPNADDTIKTFCATIGVDPPQDIPKPEHDHVLYWSRSSNKPPFAVKFIKPKQARDRHKRKYAEGRLDEDRSFYFRGPESKLKLRAHNLMLFVQLGEGVDEETWQFHRRAHDFSKWFREMIKDDELAAEAAAIEDDPQVDAEESRKRILASVTQRYTASTDAQHNWREERERKTPVNAGK